MLHTWFARAEYMPKWWFHHILELFQLGSSPGCLLSCKGRVELLIYRRPRGSRHREGRELSTSLQWYLVTLASAAT